ncbi:MAG: c-type cytochrome [Candidatus Eisenbacteria bacterium]|uniref:C-type cytochrome n=1 Tax=Eiseniibacteriota bacterium TaxID=2212470 RepID=A0A538TJM9_UNCEI|nr:MAG: c-type cytochrome [Candidatus Eisenbacteria bacterium]
MSHEPTPHGSPDTGPAADAAVSSALAKAQFFVTGLILAVVATLAYMAGMQSAKGGGHGTGEGGMATPAAKVDVSSLLKPTPELLARGKTVFQINCASCHGNTGHGDGPAAAALNPKPRNFTEGYWKFGGGLARVVRTISEGSPGTAMASFTTLPLEDRIAVAHHERSLSPKPEEDKPEDLAWLMPAGQPKGGGAEASSTGVAAGTTPAGPSIPIERAIAALAEAEPPIGAAVTPEPGPGADLYAQRCASCHGAAGQGGVRVRMLGSAPYAYVATRSLGDARGDWTTNSAAFERVTLSGIPGFVMPANGDLSRDDVRDLYAYTQKLHARLELAARSGS